MTAPEMKALLCDEPGKLTCVTRLRPEDKPGHLRIRIEAIGICGTDYHIFGGNQPFLQYPRVMGHELSGRAMADSADGRIREGDLVVVNPYLTCGECRACQIGKPNCCSNIAVLGVHTDGGMCEVIVVPEGNLYPAGDLSPQAAAMVEFLAIGAHGVRRSGLGAGTTALIVGAGPIGVGAGLFAHIAGAEVTLRDTSPDRLALAQAIIPSAKVELVSEMADTVYDTVFDATGNIGAMNAGLNYLAHGGNYVLLSVVKGDLNFADPEFHKRETTLFASRNALKVDFEHVMDCMARGLVPVDKIGTHRTTIEGAVEDLPKWAQDRGTVVKALIEVAA
ncbi:2-desacetyl-2-hydroxyethyl bacteriochlorophyllide A dehydrogenase [Salipiger thiooxidans]|uniref:2-desacetyl-2-hydroxyethyl bacteriochlorophyllide A dehydrogenase n=1 Tax=Salipiger thiooxidans TaxID=282683 RepID=A0A1G7BGY8_9RHOB|nr:zinc-binding alcohol dehydrogenase family protein [Salipiger thiooxidans]SDE26391.1 2-desacetyl-2-hydroxyethyl bacteriochlorophyllide A dehydrogenase [Salipiger thiooxidans]